MEGIVSEETWGQCNQAEAQALGRPNPAHFLSAKVRAGSWDIRGLFPGGFIHAVLPLDERQILHF